MFDWPDADGVHLLSDWLNAWLVCEGIVSEGRILIEHHSKRMFGQAAVQQLHLSCCDIDDEAVSDLSAVLHELCFMSFAS